MIFLNILGNALPNDLDMASAKLYNAAYGLGKRYLDKVFQVNIAALGGEKNKIKLHGKKIKNNLYLDPAYLSSSLGTWLKVSILGPVPALLQGSVTLRKLL